MADLDITLKRKVGAAYDVLYPTTTWTQVESKPTTFTPTSHTHVATDISNSGNVGRNLLTTSSATASTLFFKKNPDHTITLETDSTFRTSIGAAATSHTHGNITNAGAVQNSLLTPGSGHYLLVANAQGSDLVSRTSVQFGTGTTTFLRNDGQWVSPAGGGDVVGPASSTTGRVATFNGITGKLIQDGGTLLSDLVNTTSAQTIAGVKTFSSQPTTPSLLLGNQTSKATLSYTTNTAVTITIPDRTGTLAQISQALITSTLGQNANSSYFTITGFRKIRFRKSQSGDSAYTATDFWLNLNDANEIQAIPGSGTTTRSRVYVWANASGTIFANTFTIERQTNGQIRFRSNAGVSGSTYTWTATGYFI
jgi:hypothetical protein